MAERSLQKSTACYGSTIMLNVISGLETYLARGKDLERKTICTTAQVCNRFAVENNLIFDARGPANTGLGSCHTRCNSATVDGGNYSESLLVSNNP